MDVLQRGEDKVHAVQLHIAEGQPIDLKDWRGWLLSILLGSPQEVVCRGSVHCSSEALCDQSIPPWRDDKKLLNHSDNSKYSGHSPFPCFSFVKTPEIPTYPHPPTSRTSLLPFLRDLQPAHRRRNAVEASKSFSREVPIADAQDQLQLPQEVYLRVV